jgi:hypothetical protein
MILFLLINNRNIIIFSDENLKSHRLKFIGTSFCKQIIKFLRFKRVELLKFRLRKGKEPKSQF